MVRVEALSARQSSYDRLPRPGLRFACRGITNRRSQSCRGFWDTLLLNHTFNATSRTLKPVAWWRSLLSPVLF